MGQSDKPAAGTVIRDSQGDSVKVLVVKSRFARLAGQGGNKSAAALIAAADGFIAAERGRYLARLSGDLAELDGLLAALAEAGGRDTEATLAAYRRASQIRDLGSTFGFPLVTRVADSLCELLHRLRLAGLAGSAAIAAHQSALRLIAAAGDGQTDGAEDMLAGLSRVVEKYPAPQPPPAPEKPPAH